MEFGFTDAPAVRLRQCDFRARARCSGVVGARQAEGKPAVCSHHVLQSLVVLPFRQVLRCAFGVTTCAHAHCTVSTALTLNGGLARTKSMLARVGPPSPRLWRAGRKREDDRGKTLNIEHSTFNAQHRTRADSTRDGLRHPGSRSMAQRHWWGRWCGRGLRRPNVDLDGICPAKDAIRDAENYGVGAIVGIGMRLLNGGADLLGAGGRAVTE